jgi:collagenase-like PrtC family protease
MGVPAMRASQRSPPVASQVINATNASKVKAPRRRFVVRVMAERQISKNWREPTFAV